MLAVGQEECAAQDICCLINGSSRARRARRAQCADTLSKRAVISFRYIDQPLAESRITLKNRRNVGDQLTCTSARMLAS